MRIYALYPVFCFDVIRPHLRNWQAKAHTSVSSEQSPPAPPASRVSWICQLWQFERNLNAFCRRAGSEVKGWDQPLNTIENLRKYSANCRDLGFNSLHSERDRLFDEIKSYKRIMSALQTRHTIEQFIKLVQLPLKDEDGKDLKMNNSATARWQKPMAANLARRRGREVSLSQTFEGRAGSEFQQLPGSRTTIVW
jgi:hypothetical protein